jgi:hypothetical protein
MHKILAKLISIKVIRKILNHSNVNFTYRTISRFKNTSKKNMPVLQIKIILLLSGIRLNIRDDDFYYYLYNLIADRSGVTHGRFFLKKALLNRNLNKVKCKSWLRLRDIFYLKGEYVLGGICRQRALEFSSSNVGFFSKRKDRLRARIEKSLGNKDFKYNSLDYNFNSDAFNAFNSSLNCSHYNSVKSLDKKIAQILNGKSVAIVGPSDTLNNDAFEIDSYDIVVRLNYTHTGKGLDKVKKGIKIDISYFNGEQIDSILENGKGKLPSDIKIACVKGIFRAEKIKKANLETIIKEIARPNLFTFHSSFNLLPLVLLDILQFNIKCIKVFHVDLFLTKSREPGYYPDVFDRNKIEVLKLATKESFLDHDPMMQHIFLKSIYACKKITGDAMYDRAVSLESSQYLKELEDSYR